jgi:high-affinity nickel-transport protein
MLAAAVVTTALRAGASPLGWPTLAVAVAVAVAGTGFVLGCRHGLVIGLLGAAVGVLGLDLPTGIDRVFESIVGATLILLGAVVLWQLGCDRGDYQYAGRDRLVVGTVRRAWARARRRGRGPAQPLDDLTTRTAFAVGVLHGTGAETSTQVVLFASAEPQVPQSAPGPSCWHSWPD